MAASNPWLAMQPGVDPFAEASLQPQNLAALAPKQRSKTAALGIGPLVYAPPEQPLTQANINANVQATQSPVPTATSTPKTYGDYQATAPDTSRLQAILDAQEKAGQQGIDLQRQGIEQYANQVEAAKALPMGVDLTPLMSLADTWTGSKMAGTYKAPESTQDRVGQIMALQNALAKQKQGLSESEIGLLKQRLGGEESMANLKNQFEMMKLKRQELKQNESARQDAKASADEQRQTEALLKSDPYKAMIGAVDAMGAIKNIQNFIAQNGLPTDPRDPKYAQFSSMYELAKTGVKNAEQLGALTKSDTDITSGFLGPKGSIDMMLQTLGSGKEGVLAGLKEVENRYDRNLANNRDILKTTFKAKQAHDLVDMGEMKYKSAKGYQANTAPQDALSGMVKIKAPNGEIRAVPAAQKEAYLAKGGVLAE